MASGSMFTSVMAFFLLVGALSSLVISMSDLDKDREECANQLVGLSPCLPYVGGESNVPTIECCSGLKEILDKSRKCVCVLIRDRDNPNMGLKINGTLTLSLPGACHAPTNITQCIDLLHLSPNSTEAKIFKVSSSTAPMSTSDNSERHGTRINMGLGLEMMFAAVVLLWLS